MSQYFFLLPDKEYEVDDPRPGQESPDISILIAHQNALSRGLLADAFRRQQHLSVTACAGTVQETVNAVESAAVNVALIASSLQDGALSGFKALKHLRESASKVRTIMLLDSSESHLVVESFRGGAKGIFYPSRDNFKSLSRCVRQVHAGHIWVRSKDLSDVMETFAALVPLRVVDTHGLRLLAKREEDVVRQVAEGFTNREIAAQLNLSEHTVKNYLFPIFDKLGVSSRVELTLYAVSKSRVTTVPSKSQQEFAKSNDGKGLLPDKITPVGPAPNLRSLR